MKIGIVGVGVVGSAIKYGFEKLGHEVKVHDTRYDTTLKDVLNTEICYICVPTPSDHDGACDTSIVQQVILELDDHAYSGVVAIKSTVTPGTTASLQDWYTDLDICFVPEFLRERCAEVDFTEKHYLCVIGTEDPHIYQAVKESHGKYPHKFVRLSPTEAELAKYFNNTFNATLVTFANSFYEICGEMGANYKAIKDSMITMDHIPDKYLDCNASFRGFGGMCLPKDTKALNNLCKSRGIDVEFFNMLLKENSKYKTTVFKGMRKE